MYRSWACPKLLLQNTNTEYCLVFSQATVNNIARKYITVNILHKQAGLKTYTNTDCEFMRYDLCSIATDTDQARLFSNLVIMQSLTQRSICNKTTTTVHAAAKRQEPSSHSHKCNSDSQVLQTTRNPLSERMPLKYNSCRLYVLCTLCS